MSAATAQPRVSDKPSLLFIDDEPRVLKSMRAMFRRDYDVYLANSGDEALAILADNPIQVIVSDQRMPKMTGVEVLTQVKYTYPHIVRILLTGYADLEAIEASLNEAEVFRYLMKPCPADEVRAAVQSGLDQSAPVQSAEVIPLMRGKESSNPAQSNESLELGEGQSLAPEAATQPVAAHQVATTSSQSTSQSTPQQVAMKGHIVLLGSDDLADAISKAAPKAKISIAGNLTSAVALDRKAPIAILITDVPTAETAGLLKEVAGKLPHVVTLAASDRSDASLLINLINSGQAFRFLVKPVQAGRLKLTLSSAFERYKASAPETEFIELSGWQRFVAWLLGRDV